MSAVDSSRRADAPNRESNAGGVNRRQRNRPQATKGGGRWTFLGMAAPSIILLVLIYAYPIGFAFFQSVHDGNLIRTGDFIGAGNYIDNLESATFWQAARFTVIFTVIGVAGSWIVGLGLAMLLRTKTRGTGIFKVLLLLPWIVPIVVSAMAWNWMVATPNSPIPMFLNSIGLQSPAFLADPILAAILVFMFKIWYSFPFMMMMLSSALAAVDDTVYEASSIDGASKWQQFTQITLPLVRPTTVISCTLMVIFCVNDFPTIYLLTNGGPVNATTTLIVLAFQDVFLNNRVGAGTATAFMTTVILVVISVVMYRRIRKSSLAE